MVESTVYVVDDDAAIVASLEYLLGSVGIPARGFCSAQAFLDVATPELTGCLLLDVRMPGMSGLELQAELARRGCTLPVIILTGHADVPMTVRAMRRGAVDVLQKPFNEHVLLERIAEAIRVDARIRRERSDQAARGKRLSLLTTREREVLDLIVAGRSSRDIAERLGLSVRTVDVHRLRIMKKLGEHKAVDLVRLMLAGESEPAR